MMMGLYINPDRDTWGTKEDWLTVFGELVSAPSWPPKPDTVLVCLVDNGVFTAAAIAYCEHEFREFLPSQCDQRPRAWFAVPEVDVIQVCPELAEVLSSKTGSAE